MPDDTASPPPGHPSPSVPVSANMFRRLGAMFYDGLLVIGIWMLITFVIVMTTNARVRPELEFALLLGCAVVFCSYFWVAHGRTLGMQAWHLRLQSLDGHRPTLTQALARFLVLLPAVLLLQAAVYYLPLALAALLYVQAAYVYALFDPARRTWGDMFSGTRMVQVAGRAPPDAAPAAAPNTATGSAAPGASAGSSGDATKHPRGKQRKRR